MSSSKSFQVERIYLNCHPELLLLANYNIPVDYLNQGNIIKVLHAITRDFLPHYDGLMFSVAYLLKHRHTGEEKLFETLMKSQEQQKIAQNGRMISFTSVDFVSYIMNKINLDDINNQLRHFPPERAWAYDQLVSVVVSAQSRVASSHQSLPSRETLN